MEARILLCSDLDRTILPNGAQPESPEARPLFRALTERDEVSLAYVSGRDLSLLQEAVESYQIPLPDYAIGDVGTTIYQVKNNCWVPWSEWSDEIAGDWGGKSHAELADLFADVSLLRPQEDEKQNTFKLSYYTDTDIDQGLLLVEMEQRLAKKGIQASLIWSIDDAVGVGLIDVLPRCATKVHAVRFLMEHKNFREEQTVFSGDSGNDLPALTSGMQAILVKNARDEVRRLAKEGVEACGAKDKLYLAEGGFLGMNGNYSAGVLEGVAYFFPEARKWIKDAKQSLS